MPSSIVEHLVDDLLRRLPRDLLATHRAVRRARPGVQQTQVVVNLGDGADRRPRVAVGRLLVDRHRRRQTFDEVDVGLVHLAEELARVRRQRLDVTALALGEDRVERQLDLPEPGQPGEHDQAVAGQIEIDPSQIVLTRTRTIRRSATPFPSFVRQPRTRIERWALGRAMVSRGTDTFCGTHGRPATHLPVFDGSLPIMTEQPMVIEDSYTGHVSPGSAPQRAHRPGSHDHEDVRRPHGQQRVPGLCSTTGNPLLIDAANEADRVNQSIGEHAPSRRADRHHAPARRPLAGAGGRRGSHRRARPPRIRLDAELCPSGPTVSWKTVTRSPSATSLST